MTRTEGMTGRPRDGVDRRGALCLFFGAAAAAALGWLWLLTLPDVNPANWVRILGLLWLPVGVAGAVVTGLTGRRGRRPTPSTVGGLALAGLTVVGFVVLISTAG